MHCHVQLLQKDMLFPYLDIQQNYYSAKNLHIIGGVSGKVKRAPNISVSITLILMLFLTYVPNYSKQPMHASEPIYCKPQTINPDSKS